MSENPTKPTLEAIARRLDDLSIEVRTGFAGINHMLEEMDIRLDTIESHTLKTRSEVLALRASFKSSRIEDEAEAEARPVPRGRGKQRA